MDAAATGSQAVDRALTILGFFDEGLTELTAADAAARLGVHRSTASRLLAALERPGLLEGPPAGSDGPPVPSELELAAIRRRGYLMRIGDGADGGAGVAAPIRDHRGATVAAISVWGPRHRVEHRLESEIVPAVLRAADRVSEG